MEKLLYVNLTPIREYGKRDATVMFNLLESLKNLVYADKEVHQFQAILSKYVQSMVSACHENIENEVDIEQINTLIDKINSLLEEAYTIASSRLTKP